MSEQQGMLFDLIDDSPSLQPEKAPSLIGAPERRSMSPEVAVATSPPMEPGDGAGSAKNGPTNPGRSPRNNTNLAQGADKPAAPANSRTNFSPVQVHEKPEKPEDPEELAPLEVRIVRSARRKKSVGAQVKDGVVEVTVPRWMSRAEAERYAEQFRKKFAKTRASTSVDLAARARMLSRTYGLPKPLSIRWVTNQNSRWGSCTPTDSAIRINNRLAKVPTWVLDYVIVHEICHLIHPNHSAEFWALVNTYPLTERARGYLMGMGMLEDGPINDLDAA